MCGAIFITLPCLLGILLIRKFLGTNSPNNPLLWFTCLFPFALGGISFSAYPVFTYLPFNEAVVVFASFLLIGSNSSTIAISIALGTKRFWRVVPSSAPSVFNLAKLGIAGAFGYALYILPEGRHQLIYPCRAWSPCSLCPAINVCTLPQRAPMLCLSVYYWEPPEVSFFMTGVHRGLMIACGGKLSYLAVPLGLTLPADFPVNSSSARTDRFIRVPARLKRHLWNRPGCNFPQAIKKMP